LFCRSLSDSEGGDKIKGHPTRRQVIWRQYSDPLLGEPAKAVKEYKEELSAAQEQNEMLTKIVGKMTVEKEWLEKKRRFLGVILLVLAISCKVFSFFKTSKTNLLLNSAL
jgi:hypothetical protein